MLHTAGARVMFGGKPLEGHSIPAVYGAMQPTAVFVPLAQMLKPEHWPLCNTELFGPFQVGARLWAHTLGPGGGLGSCSSAL